MHLRFIAIIFSMFSIGAVSALGAAGTETADRTFTATEVTKSEGPMPSKVTLKCTIEDMCTIELPLEDQKLCIKGTAVIAEEPYKFGIILAPMPNPLDPPKPSPHPLDPTRAIYIQ